MQKISTGHRQFLNSGQIFNDIGQYFKKLTVPIVQALIRTFAVEASKYTPPGSKTKKLGTAYISKELYYRPYYNMIDMSKGLINDSKGRPLYPTKDDYAAIRNGFKFKVINTKHGVKRGTVYAYTKGINEAKRLARIQNRGLSKYSWGSILANFSQIKTETGNGFYQSELPPVFRRLAKESPNITKYTWGAVSIDSTNIRSGRMTFVITNNLTDIQRYGQIAIRRGSQALLKQWNKMQSDFENKQSKRLQKFLDFEIKKLQNRKIQ